MAWRPSTPVVAACLMGLVIGLVILSKPVPRSRLSKTEKRVSETESVAITGEMPSLRKHCMMAITVAAHSYSSAYYCCVPGS